MKNVGYRLTLACHNHRLHRHCRLHRHPPSDHPHLRGPRLHLEPRPYVDLNMFCSKIFKTDLRSSDREYFLQSIFLFQNFKTFSVGNNLIEHLMRSLLVWSLLKWSLHIKEPPLLYFTLIYFTNRLRHERKYFLTKFFKTFFEIEFVITYCDQC